MDSVMSQTKLFYLQKMTISTNGSVSIGPFPSGPKVEELVLQSNASFITEVIKHTESKILILNSGLRWTDYIFNNTIESYAGVKSIEIQYWPLNNKLFPQHIEGEVLLEKIAVTKSNISAIEDDFLPQFKRLKTLDLSYNQLTTFHLNSTSNKFLEKLILNNNLIQSLDPNTFQPTVNLKIVDLSHNQIIKIDNFVKAGNIPRMYMLAGNPIHCGCLSLAPLQQFFDDNKVWLTDLVCNTPQQVKGYDFKNATKIIKTSCF
jgi:Leucine-rich repeat (LRR) protein